MDLLARLFLVCTIVVLGTEASARAGASRENVTTTIARTLESRFPDLKILDVRPAPLPSLYEVYTGTQILYTDESADYLFSGSVFDTQSKKDLTEEGIDSRNSVDFNSLPFHLAITIVKGNGERRLAVFTDPDCPYCQALEKDMTGITDVTVYNFLLPLVRIHPQAERHARAIWCAEDRAIAWSSWMHDRKEPDSKPCEGLPLESISSLAKEIHITGTPTLYFESGRRLSHGLPASDLEHALNENSSVAVHQVGRPSPAN